MPSSTPTRYIVRARDEDGGASRALADFMRSLDDDPEIALVDQIGPAGQPHTLVISVPAHRAPALEERFRHTPQLMLERDRPLSLF
jgi:hypothetical protein